MGFGNQSRALIIASKMQGWDPTKIAGFSGPEGDISNFDHDPVAPLHKTTGTIPGGARTAWPDGYDVTLAANHTTTFNAPDASRETPSHTNHSDPTPAMPGA